MQDLPRSIAHRGLRVRDSVVGPQKFLVCAVMELGWVLTHFKEHTDVYSEYVLWAMKVD